MTSSTRLGVDIGGTFTDVVLETDGALTSIKVLTTHTAPEDGILQGLRMVCETANVSPAAIDQIIHGTTLATNALIERRGARTALITTDGFRDVIEMRSESRFEQYDLNLVLPEPLLPRQRRYTLKERVGADGAILIPLERADIDALADRLETAGYESVAVGFLHSYVDPTHERMVREVLSERLPEVSISLSSDVSPQMREYERFNTTIANAYVRPMMQSYLERLTDRLAQEGADCPVYLMHSGGGLMSLENAARYPVRLVESGPAGGAIFAADLAARHGTDKVLSFDMGGTTAKICLIKGASPRTARTFEVARSYRFKKGSGMPISIPVIDMVEIGAGGGSLASVDAMGQIRVGPQSAGSEPGPACYGRGGDRPAVTDADLVLGRLDADNFAGGAIALDTEAARHALSDVIGTPLSMDADEAALGVSEMVDENMAAAARIHAVENGEDLAGYTMIAFGGAAPLHAARLCQKLGISRLMVPPGAGVGSAIGFLRAPFSFEATRSVFMQLSGFDAAAAGALVEELTAEARGFVEGCAPDAMIDTSLRVYMRYTGQGWEIPVDVSGELTAEALKSRFEQDYAAIFGRTVTGAGIEITVWAVTAATRVDPPEPVGEAPATDSAEAAGQRGLVDPASGTISSAQVHQRESFPIGATIDGPAIVQERETTVVIPAGARASNATDGTLIVEFGDRS